MDFNVCIIKEDKAMAMEITDNYISHAMQSMAKTNAKGSAKAANGTNMSDSVGREMQQAAMTEQNINALMDFIIFTMGFCFKI